MGNTEPELERIVAAARGIPVPPRCTDTQADLGQRLAVLNVWLRFWHERLRTPALKAAGLRSLPDGN